MRIWSIHPCYLDSKGLVALWRETLLAKNVLEKGDYSKLLQYSHVKKIKQHTLFKVIEGDIESWEILKK